MAAIITASNKPAKLIFHFNGQRFLLPSIQFNNFNFWVDITPAAASY